MFTFKKIDFTNKIINFREKPWDAISYIEFFTDNKKSNKVCKDAILIKNAV